MANPFLITAAALAVFAVVSALLRDAPGRTVPTEPLARRLGATLRLGVTWQASALYAVAFGGYVAFSVYLPTYLKTGYGLEQADAANRMAGFVLLAVAMRPVGGWLSDRMGPVRVLGGSLALVVAGALVQSLTPSPCVRPARTPRRADVFAVRAAARRGRDGVTPGVGVAHRGGTSHRFTGSTRSGHPKGPCRPGKGRRRGHGDRAGGRQAHRRAGDRRAWTARWRRRWCAPAGSSPSSRGTSSARCCCSRSGRPRGRCTCSPPPSAVRPGRTSSTAAVTSS